jgi:hypothetical protein
MKTFEMKLRGFGMFSLVAMSALPLFFASCSSDNDPVETESEDNELTEIQLASTILTGNVSEWSANTRGTDVTYTNVSKTWATINTHNSAQDPLYNQELTYSSTKNLLTGSTAMYYPVNGENVDVYLYNGNCTVDPNTNSGKVKHGSKLTVTAYTNQTKVNASNQEGSDFIYGHAIDQKRRTDNLTVSMKHLMSQFTLDVKVGTDSETKKLNLRISEITLGKLINTSTYTVDSTKVNSLDTKGQAADATITLYSSDGVALSAWNGQDSTEKSLRAIFLPQNMKGKVLTISTKELDSNQAGKSFTYTFPDTDFKEGKKYVYTMTVSAMSLNITAKVVDWETQSNVDIEAGYDVPTE